MKPPSNNCQEPVCDASDSAWQKPGSRAQTSQANGKFRNVLLRGSEGMCAGHGNSRAPSGGFRMASSSRMPEPSLQDGQELTQERECGEKGFRQEE